MARRNPEPFLWLLFSAGGIVSAMLMPVLLVLFGLAFPLGWLTPPSYEHLSALFGNPIVRLALLVVCVLSLFHWAHRFRHTLNDAFDVKHLGDVIATISYGSAVVGSFVAAYLIWSV